MARTVIVWGTSSHAGKSWLVTALCRMAAARGLRVAPFKAQNMSNHARVVARAVPGAEEVDRHRPGSGSDEVGEIGSAQFFQARAARVQPTTDMNPVLLKPERDTASQVVVHGRVQPALARLPWRERSPVLAAAAREAFGRLAAAHELVIVEGAGSPAEINLAEQDYVNLGVARWARELGPTAALLVTDIDRGGAFAHLHGTWALLPADLRGLLEGFVLNRFRGDAGLLAPGPQQLEQATGVPTVGVLPMWHGHGLPEEDALFDVAARSPFAPPAHEGLATLRVAIVAAPQASNLDEFQPLQALPEVELRWAREPSALRGADWVVLPGSKQVSGDLAWLQQQGLAAAVQAHAQRGGAVLAICGGLMMAGATLGDPLGLDGERVAQRGGLGLLPLETRFEPPKRLRAGTVRFGATGGPWTALGGLEVDDSYEIRFGRTQALHESLRPVLHDAEGLAVGWQCGPVLGVAVHGLLESPRVLRALFGRAVPTLDERCDRLAEFVQQHLAAAPWPRWFGR